MKVDTRAGAGALPSPGKHMGSAAVRHLIVRGDGTSKPKPVGAAIPVALGIGGDMYRLHKGRWLVSGELNSYSIVVVEVVE